MIAFKNYKKSCIVTDIDKHACSYQGQISVLENYRVMIEIMNVPREVCIQIRELENAVLCLSVDNRKVTARRFLFREMKGKPTDEDFRSCYFDVTVEVFDVCWGEESCANDIEEFLFDSFSCSVTEGTELIGLTPYEEIDSLKLYSTEMDLDIKAEVKELHSASGFSCYAVHDVIRKNSEIRFGIKSQIQYQAKEKIGIDAIKENLYNMILFLELLSGELITTTQVVLFKDDKKIDYLGNCNFPKDNLTVFNKNNFDSRSFLRESLFKVSDFEIFLDEAVNKFALLVKSKKLAFDSYKQVLLDDDVGISTTNKFLKVMQMIEGMERNDVSEEEQKRFDEQKEAILSKLDSQEDKAFIKKHCTNNGDNFIKCIQKITKKSIMSLSGLSNNEFRECHTHTLLSNIKNDRDVYTHASHTQTPILSIDEIYWIVVCYKVFFRVEVLLELGIDISLIRKRFSHDRYFVGSYNNLFNLKIKQEENFETGEYDRIMRGFD